MKTRLTLFSDHLSQDEFNSAFDYTMTTNEPLGMEAFNRKYETFADALSTAFRFENTKEGASYWHDIIDRESIDEQTKIKLNPKELLDKLIAFNEIIGLAQGYFDVIVEHPEKAITLSKMANKEIEKRYQKTMQNDKRNN